MTRKSRRSQDLAELVASPPQLDSRILRGTAWVALGYGGRNLLSLATTLVLVRFVEPNAFGLVALAWTALVVLDEIQSAGTTSALIFRRDDEERAAASALVFSVASSIALYGVAYVTAPYVARLFHAPDLTDVIRVLTLVLVLRGLSSTPVALLERNLHFRLRAGCELVGALAQAAAAIALGVSGAGVWSLVVGQLVGTAVTCMLVWALSPWRPDPRLASLSVLRDLMRYGRFVSATNILNIANNTVDNAVVGRILGTHLLGFYAVAFRLADAPNTVIGQIVAGGRVMFPVYSLVRENLARFRRVYLQTLQRVALVALPVSVAMFAAAGPIVHALLGPGWEETITPLRVLAVYGLVKSFAAPSGEVFKGAGRPELGLYLGALQIALVLPLLIVLVRSFGLNGAAVAMMSAMALCAAIRVWLTLRLVGGTGRELARALAPSALCSVLLGFSLAILMPALSPLGPALTLALLAVAGAAVYAAATLAFARSVVGPIWGGLRGPGLAG